MTAKFRRNVLSVTAALLLCTVSASGSVSDDSFRIIPGQTPTVEASSPAGYMYGYEQLARMKAMGTTIDDTISFAPHFNLRLLNHWDNLDGTVERGYAGKSLWEWKDLPYSVSSRYYNYAAMCAAVGINGIVLNNVNASPDILTTEYLEKVAKIAEVLRKYHIITYLSVNFASPMIIGDLKSADPLLPDVAEWWKNKAKEIYTLIPDFGGFLVKANSEGQPGPCDYGRTHAEGANMLAKALKPYDGKVIWRAFVYSPSDDDRAKQAYIEFKPLDGQFDSNVIIQIKNGPIDFQPREPVSPLFYGLEETSMMPELQVTQEYLGHSNHLVFLAPQWQEFFSQINPDTQSGVAGVANIGNSPNFTAHPFARANLYAFGRLAWDPTLSPRQIAEEWVRLELKPRSEKAVEKIVGMMLDSHEAAVDYMMPVGLHHIFAFGHHYGPEPWCDVEGARPDWLPKYYTKADKNGIGFDRTAAGSDAVSQYPDEMAYTFGDFNSCPEKYMLWFHHPEWSQKTGKTVPDETVWECICRHYQNGVDKAASFVEIWKDCKDDIPDPELYADVLSRLEIQAKDAVWWKDACLLYFQDINGLPLPDFVSQPVHDLQQLMKVKLPIDNYTCPSAELLDSVR